MSSTATLSVSNIESELKRLTTKQLLAKFQECIGSATEGFVRAAVCYKVLNDRDVKVPGVNAAGAKTFLGIASGRIDPLVFRQFLMSPIRQYIEQIPVAAQRDLGANPFVNVAEMTPDGRYETKTVDIRNLRTKAEAQQFARKAFGSNGVLSIEEQVERAKKDMKAALEANATATNPDRYVRVRLSAKEYNAVKLKADRQGMTEGDVLYQYATMGGAFVEEKKKPGRPRKVAAMARA